LGRISPRTSQSRSVMQAVSAHCSPRQSVKFYSKTVTDYWKTLIYANGSAVQHIAPASRCTACVVSPHENRRNRPTNIGSHARVDSNIFESNYCSTPSRSCRQ
jgi:hypothetical protein